MAELQPFQQPVVDEKKDLDDKIQKLRSFLDTEAFKKLHSIDQDLLFKQLSIMAIYSETLQQRLVRFGQ